MKREEYRKKLSRIIGDESKVIELMIDLDNVINHDLPPAEDEFVSGQMSQMLGDIIKSRPAEGAEDDGMMFTISEDGINPLNEQPTAEGAEEIGVYDIANKWAVWVKGNEVAARDSMVADIYGLLNVHAQQIADKMVEERCIDFANWLDKLQPSERTSVWSKNGEWKGLFTMDNEQLYEKHLKSREK